MIQRLGTARQQTLDIWRGLMRPTKLAVILSVVVVTGLWLAAEHRNKMFYTQQLRVDLLQDLTIVRTQLEGQVNANIQLIRGLIATMITEPDMQQDRFASIAEGLMSETKAIRNLAAAPDMVIRMVYPVEGNEAAIGLDYRTNEAQREAAERARTSGSLVLAGPVDLVQGGKGFIGRFPVYVPKPNGAIEFWGLVSAVIDEQALYREAGLLNQNGSMQFALSGRDGVSGNRDVFFGNPDILSQDPVTLSVLLPSGSWQLSAIPAGGWNTTPPTAQILRAVMLISGLLLMMPSFLMGRLIEERQRHIGELEGSNSALSNRMAELERARAQQLKSEARLRASLDAQEEINARFTEVAGISRSWVWEQDADLRFTYLSPGFSAVTGFPPDSLIGKTRSEFPAEWATMSNQADWDWLSEKTNAREPFSEFSYGFRASDGRDLWVMTSGTPIFDNKGKFAGYRGAGTEVTSIHAAVIAAQEANRVKSMFLATMSHEIRTPMNGILGMAEMLETTLTTPSQKQMISVIRDSGEALLAILNDILDLSKIEADKLDLEVVSFRLDVVAQRIEALHKLKAQEKGLRLDIFTDSRARHPRMGDPHRMTQILHNVVGNAIKFTDRGKITVLISSLPGDDLRIEVTDTGIGMTAQEQARIFDEFTQADGSVTRRFGGTGLGMSIVRRLIDKMGGKLDLESEPGKGTKIGITLPLPLAPEQSDTQLPVQKAKAGPSDLIDLSGRQILVADDNEVNLDVLNAMLEDTGAELVVARNGQQAIEAFMKSTFDMLLLDISMPVVDGPDALRQMSEAAADHGYRMPPAIAFTANLMPHQISEYLGAGFVDVIAKPLKRQVLLAQIEKHLEAQTPSDPR
ncbi:MAG: ATP-binding protein [Paracoccaceae bacterium]